MVYDYQLTCDATQINGIDSSAFCQIFITTFFGVRGRVKKLTPTKIDT